MGAVALDLSGTVAAGHLDRRRRCHVAGPGGRYAAHRLRVYADNEAGAVSMTGLGESIIRLPSPRKLLMDWRRSRLSPAVAAARVLRKGGATHSRCRRRVVLSPDGRFAIRHSTPHGGRGHRA